MALKSDFDNNAYVYASLLLLYSIIAANKGRPPFTYKKFQRVIQHMDPPPTPVTGITRTHFGSAKTPIDPKDEELHSVPTLSQLGNQKLFIKRFFLSLTHLLYMC